MSAATDSTQHTARRRRCGFDSMLLAHPQNWQRRLLLHIYFHFIQVVAKSERWMNVAHRVSISNTVNIYAECVHHFDGRFFLFSPWLLINMLVGDRLMGSVG